MGYGTLIGDRQTDGVLYPYYIDFTSIIVQLILAKETSRQWEYFFCLLMIVHIGVIGAHVTCFTCVIYAEARLSYRLDVCPSVRHTLVLHLNDSTYRQTVFTAMILVF